MNVVIRIICHCNINPFTAPACKISGLKNANTHACEQYIFMGPVTNPLSVMCILIDFPSRAHAKGEKALVISSLALLLDDFRGTTRQAWQ